MIACVDDVNVEDVVVGAGNQTSDREDQAFDVIGRIVHAAPRSWWYQGIRNTIDGCC